METRRITTLDELREIAEATLAVCTKKESAQVISLSGDLGAGKTAFTKALARTLGVTEEVTSPTFVIMKSYAIPNHPFLTMLVHIDAYRIESDDEMRVLQFNDILQNPMNLVCIEWPENIHKLLPEDAYKLTFVLNSDGTRDIQYGR